MSRVPPRWRRGGGDPRRSWSGTFRRLLCFGLQVRGARRPDDRSSFPSGVICRTILQGTHNGTPSIKNTAES